MQILYALNIQGKKRPLSKLKIKFLEGFLNRLGQSVLSLSQDIMFCSSWLSRTSNLLTQMFTNSMNMCREPINSCSGQ